MIDDQGPYASLGEKGDVVPRTRKRSTPAVDDEAHITLADPVNPQQRLELQSLGYKGPWPTSGPQAEAILQTLRGTRAPRGETDRQRPPP
jgi:hypothetical protein